MNPRFEVGYKERLEQSQKAKNIYRLPWLGYALYRVYEIEKKKYDWGEVIREFIIQIGDPILPQYEVRWLKPKQATLLRLQGHRVEPTTADDESTVGPVRLGA